MSIASLNSSLSEPLSMSGVVKRSILRSANKKPNFDQNNFDSRHTVSLIGSKQKAELSRNDEAKSFSMFDNVKQCNGDDSVHDITLSDKRADSNGSEEEKIDSPRSQLDNRGLSVRQNPFLQTQDSDSKPTQSPYLSPPMP